MLRIFKCCVQIASILLMQFSECAFAQEKMQYVRFENTIVTDVIKNFTVDSAMKCCAVCRYTDVCVSVSYYSATDVCYLNDHNPALHQQANVTGAEGWTSFYSAVATCENDWYEYRGSCYLFVIFSRNWLDSEEYCQSLRGHLVDIQDSDEELFIRTTAKDPLNTKFIMIGLNDQVEENTFVWTSGAPVNFTDFYPGQPKGGRQENCVVQDYGGKWHDVPCTQFSKKSVCEKGLYP